MPTSAAGNRGCARQRHRPRHGHCPSPLEALRTRGFTLIELMVVVAIIAIGSAGVMFALRDSAATQLEREGLRLAALLESARAQSRASGEAVRWRTVEGGFRFEGGSQQAGELAGELASKGTGVGAGTSSGPEGAGAGGTGSGLSTSWRQMPSTWLSADTRAQGTPDLVLGPEPMLPPQSVFIESAALPGRPLQVSTDGVRPFRVGPPGATP